MNDIDAKILQQATAASCDMLVKTEIPLRCVLSLALTVDNDLVVTTIPAPSDVRENQKRVIEVLKRVLDICEQNEGHGTRVLPAS